MFKLLFFKGNFKWLFLIIGDTLICKSYIVKFVKILVSLMRKNSVYPIEKKKRNYYHKILDIFIMEGEAHLWRGETLKWNNTTYSFFTISHAHLVLYTLNQWSYDPKVRFRVRSPYLI